MSSILQTAIVLAPDIISLLNTGTNMVLSYVNGEYVLQTEEEYQATTQLLEEYNLKGGED